MARAAVFLDRDGTIVEDLDYPRDPSRIAFLPRAAQGLKLMEEKGYLLFVVSNQSGVGRGIIQPHEFEAVHKKCAEILEKEKIAIADYFYCLHAPEANCACRKPKAGHLPKSFQGEAIDFKKSYVIGDRDSDVLLADTLSARAILVRTGKGEASWARLSQEEKQGLLVASDLFEAASLLPSLR